MTVNENFLIQFILNSLPIGYATKGVKELEKKYVKKYDKGKGPLKINKAFVHIQNKASKKGLPRHKAWFEKKGKLNVYRFLTIQTISPNEKFMFMGNIVKSLVEVVDTYCLILNGHHLDLLETLYLFKHNHLIGIGYIYLLHEKYEAVDTLKIYLNEVERQLDRKVKSIKSDKDGEYYRRYGETGQHPSLFAKLL
ncbi:hypothetical protein CR513_04849, partial [Mucuna pruriens]